MDRATVSKTGAFSAGDRVTIEDHVVELKRPLTDISRGWFTTPGPLGIRYWNESEMAKIP